MKYYNYKWNNIYEEIPYIPFNFITHTISIWKDYGVIKKSVLSFNDKIRFEVS